MSAELERVFIVNEDRSVCAECEAYLKALGFIVRTFHSGKEFANAVDGSTPGCLVLDIHLHGPDGWEAQKKAALAGCKRQFILTSADASIGLTKWAFNSGAVGFLPKPVNDQSLVNLIYQAFEIAEKNPSDKFLMAITAVFLMTTALGCDMNDGTPRFLASSGQGSEKILHNN